MTRYVTLQEAARLLNRAPDTIRRQVKAGKLPGKRVRTAQGYIWTVEVPHDAEASDTGTPAASVPGVQVYVNLCRPTIRLRRRPLAV